MTPLDLRPTKEQLWLSCREKTCCYSYAVLPTGRDIWRISQALQLPPTAFTRYADAPPDADEGFALDTSTRRYQVILAKRPAAGQALAPCIFLWRLPEGHAQCGLGDLRPSVCKAYPSVIIEGITCIGEQGGCSCRTWALAQVDSAQETRLVQARERERAEYREVVQVWNERVQTSGNDREHSYIEFCNYLLNTYADREQKPADVLEPVATV